LRDSSETVRKKKAKAAINLQADELAEKADRKAKEAQVLYANAQAMEEEEEGTLVNDLAVNREVLRKEILSPEDLERVNNLGEEQLSEIRNAEDYISYSGFKKEARRLIKAAEVQYIEADELQGEIEEDKELRSQLESTLDEVETEEEKIEIEDQIQQIEESIAEKETRSASLREQATDKEKDALIVFNKAEFLTSVVSGETANDYIAIEKVETYGEDGILATIDAIEGEVDNQENIDIVIDENVTQENNDIEEEVTNANIDEVPAVLNESIFVMTAANQPSYNESKKIPTVKLPEGLVFKVQIGAFRNQIPQDHFRGFAPIMAEDAGNGITRYTAGFFKGFNMANEAKNSIREIGYSDAFVVAFFNGKRIDINRARTMVNGTDSGNQTALTNSIDQQTSNENEPQENNDNQNVETRNDIVDNTELKENNSSEENNNQTINNETQQPIENSVTENVQTEEVIDGVSTDVRNIDGVFYTIQVGVYSRPVTPGELNNIAALNSERTASGLIRYTAGVYKNITNANKAKDEAVALGIVDAFVVAYQNGNKVTVVKANELLGENTFTTTEEETDPVTIEEEIPSIDETVNNNEEVDPLEVDTIAFEPINDTLNVEFRIRLGEYEDEVPVRDAAIFLQLTSRGVASYTEDNKTIYTIGSFTDYEEALDMQSEMEKIGIEDPAILAFKDKIAIDLQKALELIKK